MLGPSNFWKATCPATIYLKNTCYKHCKGLSKRPGLQLSLEGPVSSGISIRTKVRSAEKYGNLSLHIYVVRFSHLPISSVTFPAVSFSDAGAATVWYSRIPAEKPVFKASPQPESLFSGRRPNRPLSWSTAQCHLLRTQ